MLERALERIAMVASTGKTALDLAGLDLAELPDEFNAIAAGLLSLDLSDNRFGRVPRQLGLCNALVSLDLSKNELITAYGLAAPRQLRYLALRENRFSDFPIEVLELPQLEKLDLAGNPMARVPAGISVLSRLEYLGLDGCQVEALPQEIAEMPTLREIPLAGNPLRTPPLELAMRGIEAIRTYFDDLTRENAPLGSGRNFLFAIALEQYDRVYDPRPGCLAEADALVNVLNKRYGYTDVVTLYDQQATRDAILTQLDNLSKRTQPADNIIIYFNGWTGDARSKGSDFFTYDFKMVSFDQLTNFLSGMRAKHVLLIVDNHLYGRPLAQERGTRIVGQAYASRWAMYRIGADWEERFTPRLTEFLANNTLEISVAIAAYSCTALASSLSIPGDEGGEFMFRPQNEPEDTKIARGMEENSPSEKFEFITDLARTYVASNDLDAAFELLLSNLNAPVKADFELLQTSWNNIQRQLSSELIDKFTARSQSSRIAAAFLARLDKLSESDFDLTGLELRPNTQTRLEAQQQLLNRLTEKITAIEELRNQLNQTTDTKTRRELSEALQTQLQLLEALQLESDQYKEPVLSDNVAKEQSEIQAALVDQSLWAAALRANTLDGYTSYLAQTQKGLYITEAQSRLSELHDLEREEAIVAELRQSPTGAGIQGYLTTFPNGKYRDEVEQLQKQLEAAEDRLWEATTTTGSIEAYRQYQTQTKLGNYTSLATSRIVALENETKVNRVNEAKLIFVGNGRVGKTSLTKVLAGDAFDPHEPSTHGIRIRPWTVELPDQRKVKLNVWDFGGQEIYHNTHRFFLTARALYLFVWDKATLADARAHPDKDDAHEQNFTHDYWLHNIKLFSCDAPVVMVQNKIEDGKSFVDNPNQLAQAFNVRDFCDVSAATGEDIDRLRQRLAQQYAQAPGLRELIGYDLPESWLAARTALEKLAVEKPYVKYDDYLDLCAVHELSETAGRELLAFLHEIGAVLHFADKDWLSDIVVLNPAWATDIIYRVLNTEVEAAGGRFSKAQLCKEWHELVPANYRGAFRFRDEKEVAIFLELMKAFEICFELPGKAGQYIAPQFLPRDELVLAWNSADSLKFGYAYPFLHPGLIARIIVRLSEFAAGERYWREGIAIEKAGTRGIVRADYDRKQIRIELQGANAAGLRDFVIDAVFKSANQDMQATEIVFCPLCDGPIERKAATDLYGQGEEKISCSTCKKNVALADIFAVRQPGGATSTLDKANIKALLAEDKLEEALDAIEKHLPNEAILLKARIRRVRDEYNLGLALGEERDTVRQRVIQAVLDWLA